MKAIPMKGRLKGKRIYGYMWAGRGAKWARKENYFPLEDSERVSAFIGTSGGSFEVRCKGMVARITTKDANGHVLGTVQLALPGGRKR